MSHYLSNLWTNISGKKWIVYQSKKFSIQSLFILIQFKIDQIVCDRPNITVTYNHKWLGNIFFKQTGGSEGSGNPTTSGQCYKTF